MKTTTFLTFVGSQCGKAEEAIDFYTSIFPNSEIIRMAKYSEGEAGGTPELIKHGVFKLNGVSTWFPKVIIIMLGHLHQAYSCSFHATLKMRYMLYSKNFLQMGGRLWFL